VGYGFPVPPDRRRAQRLNIIDEFTREVLATDVERSITADMLVATSERLINLEGTPRYLRFDNGPEFVAGVVTDWAKGRHITLVVAEPGCPWQNGWVESFNAQTARRASQRRTVRNPSRSENHHQRLEARRRRQHQPTPLRSW